MRIRLKIHIYYAMFEIHIKGTEMYIDIKYKYNPYKLIATIQTTSIYKGNQSHDKIVTSFCK